MFATLLSARQIVIRLLGLSLASVAGLLASAALLGLLARPVSAAPASQFRRPFKNPSSAKSSLHREL